jgi:hypothetical protein
MNGLYWELITRFSGGDSNVELLCSPSCLTEFAWKLREAQPKLSKSRQSPD